MSTNSSVIPCLKSESDFILFAIFAITNVLFLVPLCILVLHHGLQQYRQKRSTSSAVAVSHSDIFTYQVVIIELLRVLGCVLAFCGIYSVQNKVLGVGFYLFIFTWLAEMFFHVLTCVERYLAVVHPITYMNLRNERAIRIRNISIVFIWLLSAAGIVLAKISQAFMIMDICTIVFCLIIVSFCSLSVLCVLIRPGPGETGGGRKRVDQSKLRAFYTITAILGVLVVRNMWGAVWLSLTMLGGVFDGCVMLAYDAWFSLPSSLVSPLLFLQRTGNLKCCKKNIQQG